MGVVKGQLWGIIALLFFQSNPFSSLLSLIFRVLILKQKSHRSLLPQVPVTETSARHLLLIFPDTFSPRLLVEYSLEPCQSLLPLVNYALTHIAIRKTYYTGN